MRQTIIEAKKNPFSLNFKDLLEYRELLWTLTYRDLRVRYAQTALGVLWAFLNPIFMLAILSFVFGTIAKVKINMPGVPHVLYTAAGLAGWTYFQSVVTAAGSSLLASVGMIKKIYFPRLLIPLSKALTSFIDLIIVFICLILLMLYYGIAPGPQIVWLPLYILISVIAGLAGGIWLSALTIRYRDFKQITPLMIRLGTYATPIAFPASSVPEKYQFIFFLNPMAGVVEGMRWSILGGPFPSGYSYLSYGVIFVLFILSIFYFRNAERHMADIL